ncbi:MAG: hypothetical protein JNL74_10435, partial [Fibrobacteres bacterium]|nr:hypothetical protein [Fibrobacterota bacterium]
IQNDKELNIEAQSITKNILEMGKKDIRLLVNVANTTDSKAAQFQFAESAKQLKPYCAKIAVIGTTSIKSGIINIINKFMGLGVKSFPDETTACDWLIAP